MSKAVIIPGADFSAHAVAQAHFPDNPCTGISIDPTTYTVTALNQSFQITPALTPANTDDPVIWTSSNESIATVDNGIVTSHGVGSVTITATCGDYSATCEVTAQATETNSVVAGYWYRSSSTGTGTGDRSGQIDKYTQNSRYYVLAGNSESGNKIYGTSYDSVDTSPWRFVPIALPAGTGKITIDSPVPIKTNTQWINKDLTASWGGGARILQGLGGTNYEQDSFASTIVLTVPSIDGVNAVAIGMFGDSSDAAYKTANAAIDGFTITYTAS